jgi:hypothetical protein
MSWYSKNDDESIDNMNSFTVNYIPLTTELVEEIKKVMKINSCNMEVVNEDGDKVTDIDDEIYTISAQKYVNSTYNNIQADRYFGPLNSKIDFECKMDGCRMLTCCCNIYELDNSWFNGYCELCDEIITDISHSLRMPCDGGGWIGCYCSVECLHSEQNKDKFFVNRWNMVAEVIISNGIFDRL